MKYWKSLLSSRDTASSKRLVTLIMAAHLIVTSLLVSFFTFYLILYVPKGTVNPSLIELLKVVLGYDFYIVLAGLTFITQETFGQLMLQSAKAKAEAVTRTGLPQADTINVDTVNVDQKEKEAPAKKNTKRQ